MNGNKQQATKNLPKGNVDGCLGPEFPISFIIMNDVPDDLVQRAARQDGNGQAMRRHHDQVRLV